MSFPNFKISELYIKWNEELSISAEKIIILNKSDSNNSSFNYKKMDKLITKLSIFDNFIEKIDIKIIKFNDIYATFKYIDNNNGYLIASSPSFQLKSYFFFESNLLNIHIKELIDKNRKIDIDGNIIFDSSSKELTTALNIDINKDAQLQLLLYTDKNKLLYRLLSKKRIKSIDHIMQLLKLNKHINYWAYKAIDTKDVDIKSAYGWIDYSKLDSAIENIYVDATLNKLKYTYHKSLDPINSQMTQLEFKKGILFIRPKDAYTYGTYLNKSCLNIDFTKEEELLTLHLLFDGKLDKNVLNILNTYKIKIPFLQNTGITKTDLIITVGLRDIDVYAKGDFFTKKGNFDYLGLNLDVSNAHIFLDGYDIKIKDMFIDYQDIASAKVNVNYNAKINEGDLLFDVTKINLEKYKLSLNKKLKPLKIEYKISPKFDNILIENQNWIYNDKNIKIDKISIPFDLKNTTFNLPRTLIKSEGFIKAYISGKSNIKKASHNYNIDLISFNYKNIELTKPNVKLNIKLEKDLYISNKKNIAFSIKNIKSILGPTKIKIDENAIYINDSQLNIKNILNTKITGYYSLNINAGKFSLKDTKIKEINIENINLDISKLNKKTIIKSPELQMKYEFIDDRWKLNIESLDKLSKYVTELKKYNLTNGKIYLYSKDSLKTIQFKSSIVYPYKLLVDKNKLIENYLINGEINKKTNQTKLTINDSINISIDKNIDIKAKDIDFNISEFIKLLKNNKLKTKKQNNIKVTLNANNSRIYISENRHIISDKILLNYKDNKLSLKLNHANGTAHLTLDDDNINCYGDSFNDKFMEKLFALSKFDGGSLSFSIHGKLDNNQGILNIKNTTLLEFKVLNNILAFINTIPSLITLSLPDYSTKGLKVDSAYMEFNSLNYNFHINKFNLHSKELIIDGGGNADFIANKIDVLLNLRSDVGSSLSQIPIIGNILLGKEAVSTTLRVSGDLDNPKVQTGLGKNIINAPINIIKRILTFSFQSENAKEEE